MLLQSCLAGSVLLHVLHLLHSIAVSVCRSAQLQCELEEQAAKLHKAQAQLDKAEHLLSEKDTESAIGKAAAEAAARNISALRGELKAHADAAAKVSVHVLFARSSVAHCVPACARKPPVLPSILLPVLSSRLCCPVNSCLCSQAGMPGKSDSPPLTVMVDGFIDHVFAIQHQVLHRYPQLRSAVPRLVCLWASLCCGQGNLGLAA